MDENEASKPEHYRTPDFTWFLETAHKYAQ